MGIKGTGQKNWRKQIRQVCEIEACFETSTWLHRLIHKSWAALVKAKSPAVFNITPKMTSRPASQ